MNDMMQSVKLLQQQLEAALQSHTQLRNDLASLKDIHQQLEVEKQTLLTESNHLKEQLKTIKLAQALVGSSDQDNRSLKIQINGYLREIDKCLALLNRDLS